MKKYKVQQIIKLYAGNVQLLCDDGTRMFWPREYMNDICIGTKIQEHKHKDGKLVAFSWGHSLRFMVDQPMHFNESFNFVSKFKLFDQVAFNNAVVRAMRYRTGKLILPNTEQVAHNMVLFGLKSMVGKVR